jgi:ubiquinone/menaquinone biosynthesis C-methylase UbiE
MRRDKGYKGLGMEGSIATWYAKHTWKESAAFRRLAERFAKETPADSHILEVAPGPSYLAIALAQRGQYAITGLDISHSFVAIARANAHKASVTVHFRHGNASAMPFADGTFDLIVCRAAFKNFSQPLAAIDEMHRVLKPGGRAVIMDLRKEASVPDMRAYITKAGYGWFDAWLMRLIFRFLLLPRAYTKAQVTQMAARSRFGRAAMHEVDIGFEIVLTKERASL